MSLAPCTLKLQVSFPWPSGTRLEPSHRLSASLNPCSFRCLHGAGQSTSGGRGGGSPKICQQAERWYQGSPSRYIHRRSKRRH